MVVIQSFNCLFAFFYISLCLYVLTPLALKFEVGYNVRRLGFLGMDSVHLLGTTCGRTGVIINNIVASRRFNVFGQPSTVAVKLSGQDMEPWIGLKLTSISVKAKNSFAPTSNSMIHMNSCISFGTNGSKFNGATIFQLLVDYPL